VLAAQTRDTAKEVIGEHAADSGLVPRRRDSMIANPPNTQTIVACQRPEPIGPASTGLATQTYGSALRRHLNTDAKEHNDVLAIAAAAPTNRNRRVRPMVFLDRQSRRTSQI
jgi:hypothetical protein